MPDYPPSFRQRALVCRAVVDALRCYSQVYFGNPMPGRNMEDLLIGCCLIIGRGECRPMSASDIAEYVGMPRATVVRRIRAMQKQGLITASRDGRRVQYLVAAAEDPAKGEQVMKMIRRLRQTFADLSNLDDDGVAK